MKKFLFIIAGILASVASFSQTEETRDSIPINLEYPIQLPHTEQRWSQESEINHSENTIVDPETLRERYKIAQNMKIPPINVYEGPIQEENPLGMILPSTHDYAFYNETDLGNNFSISTASTHREYIGIGANRTVGVNINYAPNEWVTLTGGVYTAKYAAYGSHYNDAGISGSIRLKLHDRVYIRGHALYSAGAKNRNFGPAAMGLYPQNYYGGGIEFKITEKFGVEGGVVRELNPNNGKWMNVPYVMPIFYRSRR